MVFIIGCILLFFFAGVVFMWSVFWGSSVVVVEWEVMCIEALKVSGSWVVDLYSMLFWSVVLLITANVSCFAYSYMELEVYYHRFFLLVLLFVFSMGVLIFSSSFVGLLVGWDGLGLSSFLLVIYYQNSYSAGSGLITGLTNRVGDVFFIFVIVLGVNSGCWQLFSVDFGVLGGIFLVLGAMTKSAQVPFSSWLPMAMAAPTPVSALVHSSTLVTAGVYVLIRFYYCVEGEYMGLLGGVTMLLAGVSAFSEFDMKKVIAFSTLSQLGVMMVSLGFNMPGLAFFHMLGHAIFKALLFICAGSYIHFHGHCQDMRMMGNLGSFMPLTQSALVYASFSLCGFPFMTGFYCKDPILELGMMDFGWGVFLFVLLGSVLTTAYSARSMCLGQFSFNLQSSLMKLHDGGWGLFFPVLVLGLGSVVWGCGLNWWVVPSVVSSISLWSAGVSFLLIWVGVWLGYLSCMGGACLHVLFWYNQVVSDAACNMWFLQGFSSQYVVGGPLSLAGEYLSVCDQGWLEFDMGWVCGVVGWVESFKWFNLFVYFFFMVLLGLPGVLWFF